MTPQDIAVLTDFDNRTGNAALDGALKPALEMALRQSPFLRLLTDRKVSETLQAMGQPADGRLTMDTARKLCLRTGSKAVLGGTISGSRGDYLIDLVATACSSGGTLAEAKEKAGGESEVLAALSRAAAKLRAALGEPAASVRAFGFSVERATASLESLKYYSLGTAMRHDKGDTPSIPLLKRAVELDPGFPLPYASLATVYGNLRQPSLAQDYAGKAYRLRERASERDKLEIAGIYFLETGQLESEIRNYKRWQQKYPLDYLPYNNLGNDYAALGDLEESLAEYQQALQLNPGVISYTNVVGMDLSLNRLDAAQAMLDEAAARELDGRYLRQSQYWVSFVRGDIARMQRQVDWARGKPNDEDPLLSMASDTEAYYGRRERARALTQQAVDSATHAGSPEAAALWRVNAALREAEWGESASASQDALQALALSQGRDVRLMAAFTLARAGVAAEAQTLVKELERDYPSDSLLKIYWLPCIAAAIALDDGNPSEALKDLEPVRRYELGGAGTFINYVYPAYLRGLAYLQVGDAGSAAVEFRKLPDHSGLVTNFVTGALAYLELGRAYALGHDTANAKAAYRHFFTLWKDADPAVPVLQQARVEYTEFR